MEGAARVGPGTILGGDFRVVRRIGAGSMGVVFLAEQLSTGSQRAIKLLDPEIAEDARHVDRFLNEAKLASRIRSEHVVQIIAAGRDDTTGSIWLAMELLEGESLEAHVKRVGKLSLPATRLAMSQLCHALAAAHDEGIVHRDVKPENVFVTVPRREGEAFTVKLLDLGIAKLVAVGMTTTLPLGTPMWMAPEQTDPSGKISPASDTWALGLLAFFMLTGHYFWLGVSGPRPSPAVLLREVLFDPIPAASERARALGSEAAIPPGLDAWFARCVQRDPAARFPDARAAAAAFDACLAPPTSSPEVVGAPRSPRTLVWIVVALAALMLLTLVAGAAALLAYAFVPELFG